MLYHFHFLSPDGSLDAAHEHVAAEDIDALDAARNLGADRAMEIWQGDRLVARLDIDGAALI